MQKTAITFHQLLDDIPAFETLIAAHWKFIVGEASKELHRLVVRQDLSKIPIVTSGALRGAPPETLLPKLFNPYGMCAIGPWVSGSSPIDNNESICIHWARLLGILPTLPVLVPMQLPYTSLMVWGFSEIFKRFNIVYYSLLRRKLLINLAEHAGSADIRDEVPSLSPVEDEIFAYVSKQALNPKSPMVSSVRESFTNTFERASVELQPKRPAGEYKYLPSTVLKRCSRWDTKKFEYWESLILTKNPEPAIKLVRANLFRPRTSNPIVNEVFYMYDTFATGESRQGVRQTTSADQTTLVDMGEFARCRTLSGCDFYTEYRRKIKMEKVTWRGVAGDLVAYFQEHFAGLTVSDAYYKKFIGMLPNIFSDAKPEHILFVPRKCIAKKIKALRHTLPARRAPRPETRAPAKLREVRLISKPVAEANKETFTFYAIRKGVTIYFKPPWNIATKLLVTPANVAKAYKKGVYYDERSRSAYCTFKFLVGLDFGPLKRYPRLQSWLGGYSKMTATRFSMLWRQHCGMVVNPATRDVGHCAPYVGEEDNIICKLYKPGMTEGDKQVILSVCVGRVWPSIRLRASTLCTKLVSAGCTDITLLPTCNHNAKLLKSIAKKKKELGET